jgi:hypothetical protein
MAELTDVGVFGGGEAAVRALRAPEPELEQLDLVDAGGDAVAGRVRRDQAAAGTEGRFLNGFFEPAEKIRAFLMWHIPPNAQSFCLGLL